MSSPVDQHKRFWNGPFTIEMVIGLVLVGVFCFMFIHSLPWPEQAALFPRMISIGGALFTLAYMGQQIYARSRGIFGSDTRILDIPWARVEDKSASRNIAFGVTASAVLFWIGIWLVGFHVAAPVYLFSQLMIYGKTKAWQAALGALFLLVVIVGVYDKLAGTTWNDPLLWDFLRRLTS